MLVYDEALRSVRSHAAVLPMEDVPIARASGRLLAQGFISPASLPPFDNAALDGYALAAEASTLEAGAELEVVGCQAAGAPPRVARGAWEIMTGACLPDGLDTVVPREQVTVLSRVPAHATRVRLDTAVETGRHVRRCGEDVAIGQQVLAAGQWLGATQMMLLHALGASRVAVRRRPRVAVLATGGELIDDPRQPLLPGQIRDANRPYLCLKLQEAGAEVVWQGGVDDDPARFQHRLDEALAYAPDLVISTGAVSAGAFDFVPQALRVRNASLVFHQVALRPGKPLLFARLREGPLYFGLPGNPAATAVGQRFFVEAAVRAMLGLPEEVPWQLPLHEAWRSPLQLHACATAQVFCSRDGRLSARVLPAQHSFRLRPLCAANAWAVAPAGIADQAAGAAVEVWSTGHLQAIAVVPEPP
ncbi:MAG TPA: molybdopterin molybdotransferase MoeA [Stenotrophomonas sp.]|nr:molybdopterin molybdotransferase MoeA [Stenotrophomonas sp.]